jgi:membrane protease subunit (stomatin/prohibitin family)
MAEKWEYKSVNYGADNPTEITNKLNLLGDEGWEAVGVSQKSNATGITLGFYVLLKRPQTEKIAKQVEQAAEQAAKAAEQAAKAAKAAKDNQSCRYCKKPFLKTLKACPNCFPEN